VFFKRVGLGLTFLLLATYVELPAHASSSPSSSHLSSISLSLSCSGSQCSSFSAGFLPDSSLVSPQSVASISLNATLYETDVVTVKILSGPGTFTRNSINFLREVNLLRGQSLFISNDGQAGVTIIQSYLAGFPITQSPISITFYGKAEKFVATANSVTAAGYNLSYGGSDSVTSGLSILTFVATDAAGIAVPSASQNRNQKFFLHSSDTTVVRGKQSASLGYGECTAPANSASGLWACDMFVIDSGTVTLTVTDSMTIASSLYKSNEIKVTVAGAAYKGTVSFDKIVVNNKSSVQAGENVLMTITCVDRADRACGQATTSAVAYSTLFNTGGTQTKQFIGGVTTGSGVSIGTATFTTVYDWTAGSVFMGGTETALVTMPLTAGDVVISLTTGGTTDLLPVVIPTLVVTNADVTAATASADAATDAAADAIDAANAATDAANLAAEAADAATVAAEEARDAADAATAAVEELATQVATLMAALRAQIKTLANTVAKIAKKVKA
jgi:hypothetical protein